MRNQLTLIVIIICTIVPLTCLSQVDLTKGLMAYYPFNGNANDASGNGNNPVFNNTTLTTDYYGNANNACQFNGIDTYIRIPNSSTLSMGNTISVCAWIKPTGFYYGACHGNSVLVKGDNDFSPGNYMLRFDDGMFTGTNCYDEIPDTVHQTYYGIGTGLSPVQDTPYAQKNIWRSVVYTYDGLHARLYIDCNLVLDSEQPGLSFSNNNDLVFGRLNNVQFPYWLNAALDEVRIYNRALNVDEVRAYSFSCADEQPCSNWTRITSSVSGIQIGDLDVPGNQITVEALFNRTTPYFGPQLYAGDLVSKHEGPGTANYLLRPNSAEITTSNGYFKTPDICDIQLNKTYHVAMVYDGKILKFYRNGFLMSSINCSGNLFQNNYFTTIGSLAVNPNVTNENLVGYINEVRIWNVARSQNDIKKYMNQPLPNPADQTGLLAYYTLDNLKNKQGNSDWDGKIIGNARINQINPQCASFVADSCDDESCNITADFKYIQQTCNPASIRFQSTTANVDSIWWNFGNGITAGNVADTLINYASFGNYLVKQFAKTNKGCFDTIEYAINVSIKKDSAIINNDTSICAGDSVQLNAVKGLDYCWSPSVGLSNISIKNPIATPLVTTKYYLHVLTDSSKPVVMDSILITVLPLPQIQISDDTIVCGNAPVQLNAGGASSYIWSPATGLSNTTIANPIATVSSSITYTVTGIENNSCSSQDSVTITVNPVPVFAVSPQDTSICPGDSIMLTATGGDTFKWLPDDNILGPSLSSPIIYPALNTTYTVIVNNSVCKMSDTLNADIIVNEAPHITIMKSNDVDCLLPQATLTASGGIQYTWGPATFISNIHINNPVVSPPSDTWYFVNAKGQNGCKHKDSILVRSSFVIGASPFQVPGAFTPNNDGLNDCFSLRNWGPVDYFDILIYDRWGRLVFHSNNINSCWDGAINGTPQSAGTYVYQIKVSSKCTEGVVSKKGTLVLIR